jgi:tetratricopeptide (TPR) repeat protein
MGNARHQLFIMDSCYGGLLAVTRASLVNPNIPDYLNEISGRVARQVITAGGKDQQVLDGGPKGHSFFVDYFLEALAEGKADTNGDGYITFSELSSYLIPRASNRQQTPSFSPLAGHQAGEYLFRSPRGVLVAPVSRVDPSNAAVRAAVGASVRAALTQATFDLPNGLELAIAGKCAEALPYLKRGIDVDPENAPAQFYLGHCQISTGDYQGAYLALTEAIRLDQRRQEYFVDRARAAYELGQYGVATRDVDQALKLNNREPSVYDVRGDIFMKQGNYGEAANAYMFAFDLARDSKVCNKYADAIGRNGNRELADEVRRNCGR